MGSLRAVSARVSRRTDARSNGAADGSKDPEKLMPDLEVGEKRDGETRTTEKEAQITGVHRRRWQVCRKRFRKKSRIQMIRERPQRLKQRLTRTSLSLRL